MKTSQPEDFVPCFGQQNDIDEKYKQLLS